VPVIFPASVSKKAAERIPRRAAIPKFFPALEITQQDNGLQSIGNVEKRVDFGGGNRMISGRNHNYFDKAKIRIGREDPEAVESVETASLAGFRRGNV
jgi:hypothetical protein